MPRRKERGFIAVPPVRSIKSSCTIDGTDVSEFIISGNFPHGLISEELVNDITLDNSGEDFDFSIGDIIIFKMDFSDGSTTQFEGEIEEIRKAIEDGVFKLKIKGAHYTARLLDVMVTEEYSEATLSDIRKDLIDTYLTGFTYTNIEENSTSTDIKFVNKPLLDCLIALDIEGDEDTYVDFDKNFHTFKRESKTNLNIHFTDDDSIISLSGLGKDSAEVRNKVQVIGDAGGLPVIHTSADSSSETTYRSKESVITDTSIDDEDKAGSLADAEKTQLKDPKVQGSITSLFWAGINPADMAYIISPTHKIHGLYRIVKFIFKIPDEQMEVFFNQERSIPKLFKDRIKKEQGQEAIVNPHKMTHSFNFTFDNEDKIDSASSTRYTVTEGIIKWDGSGENAVVISIAKETPITVNSIHILAKGETLTGATYFVQADSGAEFEEVSLDTLTTITNTGTELKLKIIISNADTQIDSVALLYK